MAATVQSRSAPTSTRAGTTWGLGDCDENDMGILSEASEDAPTAIARGSAKRSCDKMDSRGT
jgi:hypothetical protein